jgi:hypothetical protein
MTTLSLEARNLLDRYLAQIRLSLGGAESVDAEEVKRDVREHIETEIGDRREPVTAAELQRVIDRLGDPEQWVDEGEIPAWRRVLARLTTRESWRLAYACFGLSLLGLALIAAGAAVGIVLLAGGYVLARAGRAHLAERNEDLGARRWLLDSSLLAILLPALGFLLIGPLLPVAFIAYEEGVLDELGVPARHPDESPAVVRFQVGLAFATVGIWWVILGLASARFRRTFDWLMVPLRCRPAYGITLAALGLASAVVGFILLHGA